MIRQTQTIYNLLSVTSLGTDDNNDDISDGGMSKKTRNLWELVRNRNEGDIKKNLIKFA